MWSTKPIREKPHRLVREAYQGQVTVAFTACVANRYPLFHKPKIVDQLTSFLRIGATRNDCEALIYCFMPDHLHVILQGTQSSSDTWRAMVDFKQYSGYWLAKNNARARWQRGFYDQILRDQKRLITMIQYIVNNPVRKGLACSWDQYPYTGSFSGKLDDLI